LEIDVTGVPATALVAALLAVASDDTPASKTTHKKATDARTTLFLRIKLGIAIAFRRLLDNLEST